MKKMNLILVPESSNCDIGDFHAIAKNINQMADDIRVSVIKRRNLWWQQFRFIYSPSLYIAFYEAKKFKPLRGLCLHGEAMGKSEQYVRMRTAGLDVLPWQKITPGERFDSASWGDMVIVKPDTGSQGENVYLAVPENVRYEADCSDGQDHLVQTFVNTGDNPCYFRALTFFGETLYLRKTVNTCSQLTIDSRDVLPDPVANAAHGMAELVNDAEVIEFARQLASKAFPKIPLLGQDIVRDNLTGKLYCLEVNPYGSTWHFSSKAGRALQQRDNIDYRSQFDAFDLAARVLVEKTRLLAI